MTPEKIKALLDTPSQHPNKYWITDLSHGGFVGANIKNGTMYLVFVRPQPMDAIPEDLAKDNLFSSLHLYTDEKTQMPMMSFSMGMSKEAAEALHDCLGLALDNPITDEESNESSPDSL